jgi:flagellar biosynthesis GTPase FlhF
MTNDTATELRPVAHDDFETVHPDELIAHLSQTPILKTAAISLGLHVVLILLLSIGNFAMCAKYKTFSVTGAVAEHAAALKEEKASEKKAARAKAQAAQKAKREATQAKSDAGNEPQRAGSQAAGTEQAAAEKSAIERELEEISSERPTESSMSLDDMDDGL